MYIRPCSAGDETRRLDSTRRNETRVNCLERSFSVCEQMDMDGQTDGSGRVYGLLILVIPAINTNHLTEPEAGVRVCIHLLMKSSTRMNLAPSAQSYRYSHTHRSLK